MDDSTVKRLALILAVQAEIEGMKAQNTIGNDCVTYGEKDFKEKAEELRGLAYIHEQQLFG